MSPKGRLDPMFLNRKRTPKNSFIEVVHYQNKYNFNTSNVKRLL